MDSRLRGNDGQTGMTDKNDAKRSNRKEAILTPGYPPGIISPDMPGSSSNDAATPLLNKLLAYVESAHGGSLRGPNEAREQAWGIAREQLKARVVQAGYDTDEAQPMVAYLSGADEGDVGMIREVNQGLREALPGGAYFVDLERVAVRVGRDGFYDPRRYH